MNTYVHVVGLNHLNITVYIGDTLILRPTMISIDDTINELCIEAKLLETGIESSVIGYVGREFLGMAHKYENRLCCVVKLYSDSNNRQEQKVSKERAGVCLCKLID